MKNDAFRRWMHLTGWRLRYLWLDTPVGRWINLGAAALLLILAVFLLFDAHSAAKVGEPVGAAIWVQLVIMVVSSLILMALTPKTPDATDQVNEAPRVEDGAGVRMVFGEVWITDPAVIGWKKMGTKTIRGKKSGFNGRPIIGYWYKQLFHFVLCRGPVDAVLEFRGGDKTAWKGELTAGGEVQINQRELWGGQGTGGEGGIEGPLEFLFGDADQQPSSYLAGALGTQQPAYRALLTALFKGGLWGAFSPYPKAASFKVRRIVEGWEREGGAWHRDAAAIGLSSDGAVYSGSTDFSEPLSAYTLLSGGLECFEPSSTGMEISGNYYSGFSVIERQISSAAGQIEGVSITFMILSTGDLDQASFSLLTPEGSVLTTFNVRRSADALKRAAIGYSVGSEVSQYFGAAPLEVGIRYRMDAFLVAPGGVLNARITNLSSGLVFAEATVAGPGGQIDRLQIRTRGAGVCRFERAHWKTFGAPMQAMNPAHILYQSITDSWMGAEPEAGINDASFRSSADVLRAERFGLCTEWDSTSETVEQFQQRICDVIGANLSRSPVDGKWNLDLIRGDYAIGELPVLTDDDIIDYSEQPGTLQDAVNQVIVEWRDPQRREDRSTAPVQSLGSIQAVGAVVGEVATYREIPDESLALRVAGRNLQSKSRPLRRSSIKVTRIAHAWRPGQVFRLQSVRRGIASMYCRIGDIDRGSLRSGAISLTALEDVFGLPLSVYVVPDVEVPVDEDDIPRPVASSSVQEAPYAMLAALQPPGELSSLPVESGYLFSVAMPSGDEIDYSLQVDSGAGYAEQAESDWAATATNVDAVGRRETFVSVAGARGFEDVAVGSMVLWGAEICRLDDVDLIAGAIVLGRGCADTVPFAHSAGERLWVIDDSIALDANRYAASNLVFTRLLPRTASSRLDMQDAASTTVAFASRAARPYPPAAVTLNGAQDPIEIFEVVDVAWSHRDRIASAEQLIDQNAASVGPEAGTTYTVRWFIGGVLDHVATGVSGNSASHVPSESGSLRVEVEAVRGGFSSWQSQTIECLYRSTAYADYVDQAAGVYIDQVGDNYNG